MSLSFRRKSDVLRDGTLLVVIMQRVFEKILYLWDAPEIHLNTHVYEGRIDSFLTKKKKETPQRISNLFFTFPFSGKSNHFMQLLWDITFATNEEKHC